MDYSRAVHGDVHSGGGGMTKRIDYEAELPRNMVTLIRDYAGRPVPWFVEWIDGKPDFRVMSHDRFRQGVRYRLCFMCGRPLSARGTFLVGPMCAVNRTSAEPPHHYECARYAARHCPFLITPGMVRRTTGLPEERHVAGVMIERNPGVALLWTTKKWKLFHDPRDHSQVLFEFGPAERIEWFCEGRAATRVEVEHSIYSGLPLLMAACEQEATPAERAAAKLDVEKRTAETMTLVPAS